MAINTYGTLKTAVASYLNRSDLTSSIPDFVKLGARRIFYGGGQPYDTPPLRVPAMQAQDTGAVSGGYISFPDSFLEPIRLAAVLGSTNWTLNYVSPANYSGTLTDPQTANTYTYLNNAIYTAVDASTSYILDYYRSFTLTNDSDDNWILLNAPDIYLYSSLIEASPFLGDDPRINLWFGLYKSSVSSLNRSTQKQGSGLAVRPV